MAIDVRKGSDAVERALVACFNTLRVAVADGSRFVHREATAITTGNYMAPAAAPLAITAPPASDVPSLLRLCAEIASKHGHHLRDAFAHKQPDTANGLSRPPPDTLVTAQAFLTDAKAKWNAHLTAPGVHVTNDPQPISAPDATDQQTAIDLANTYRAVFAAHIQNALPGASIHLIES